MLKALRVTITAGAVVALLSSTVVLPAQADGDAPTQRYVLDAGSTGELKSALSAIPANEKDLLPAVTAAIADLTVAEAAKLDAIPGIAVYPDAVMHTADTQDGAPQNLSRLVQPTKDLTSAALETQQYWYPASAGQGVRMYVLDSGVQEDAVEFGDRLLPGYDATTDVVGAGKNADCLGHGTGVASVAAGATYGVAKKATIVPVKVSPGCDRSVPVSDMVRGIDWIVANHVPGTPAVLNISIAAVSYPGRVGGDAYTVIDDAVNAAITAGIFVAIAAGNDSNGFDASDACQVSPARVPAAFTVGAFDGTGETGREGRTYFSNAGPCLDAFAPGLNIDILGLDGKLKVNRGTSFAAPAAAGLGALLLADAPTSTPAQTGAALIKASQKGALQNDQMRGLDATVQMLSASRTEPYDTARPSPNVILQVTGAPVSANAAVSGVTVSATTTAITMSWAGSTAPIRLLGRARSGVTQSVTTKPGDTSFTFTGLATNDTYQITVRSITDGLYSAGTIINTATMAPPKAPGAPTITVTGAGAASWADTSSNGSPITGYTLQTSVDKITWTTLAVASSAPGGSAQLGGLTASKTYFARINAKNAIGTGVWSSTVSFTTPAPPKVTAATPTISGTTKVGYALTANPGTWGPSDVGLSYQWYRSGAAISRATAKAYTLTSYDKGKTMTVRVLGAKTGYASVAVMSRATAAVAAGTLRTSTPTISGTKRSGYTLTANPGVWGPAPVTLTYRWYRSGAPIANATGKSYRLVYADRWDTIKVRVTGTKAGYTGVSRYSGSTVKIP